MGKVITAIIKRTLFYLVLGFITAWLVAWGLAMVPRVTYAGYFSWSVRYSNPFQGIGDRVYPKDYDPSNEPTPELLTIMDSRWIGVQEVQYFVDSRSQSIANIGTSAEISSPWWMLTIHEQRLGVNWQWINLKEEFRSDSSGIQLTDYAILRYGFPFMSHETHAAYRRSRTPSTGWQEKLSANGIITQEIPPYTASVWNRRDQRLPFAELIYLPYIPLWLGLMSNTLFYAIVFWVLISAKRSFCHARRFRKGKCPMCAYDLLYDNTLGCPECGWHKAPISKS